MAPEDMTLDTRHLLSTTSAALWADAFEEALEKNPDIAKDWGTMVSWFANAIETGRGFGERGER